METPAVPRAPESADRILRRRSPFEAKADPSSECGSRFSRAPSGISSGGPVATDARGERCFDAAARWFASTNRVQPFAFETVCDVVGLDAALVRANLRRWRAMQFVAAARQWLDQRDRLAANERGLRCRARP